MTRPCWKQKTKFSCPLCRKKREFSGWRRIKVEGVVLNVCRSCTKLKWPQGDSCDNEG